MTFDVVPVPTGNGKRCSVYGDVWKAVADARGTAAVRVSFANRAEALRASIAGYRYFARHDGRTWKFRTRISVNELTLWLEPRRSAEKAA